MTPKLMGISELQRACIDTMLATYPNRNSGKAEGSLSFRAYPRTGTLHKEHQA